MSRLKQALSHEIQLYRQEIAHKIALEIDLFGVLRFNHAYPTNHIKHREVCEHSVYWALEDSETVRDCALSHSDLIEVEELVVERLRRILRLWSIVEGFDM